MHVTRHSSRRRVPCLALAVLLAVLLLSGGVPAARGKGIHVSVEASWNETSLAQEGCEWAARAFGDAAFYACLDVLWSPTASSASAFTDARTATQQAQYARLLEVLFQLPETRGADRAFFVTEMAARVYSPAVEAHYALADTALPQSAATAADDDTEQQRQPDDCAAPFALVHTRPSAGAPLETRRITTAAALTKSIEAVTQPGTSQPAVSVPEVAFAEFDHLYPSTAFSWASAAPAVVVVYGLPGSLASHALHRAAAELAVPYVWRHLPVSEARLCGSGSGGAASTGVWDSPLVVSGYGVTVDIKNMEYKVLDEKAAAQQREKEAAAAASTTSTSAAQAADAASTTNDAALVSEASVDRIVGGFHVARLKERFPALAASLDEFAAHLDEEVGSGDMKVDFDVWELQSIGLAATQYIRDVGNHSRRLHVLKDVVTRFPTYAAALSRLAAQPSRLEGLQKALAPLHQRVHPGASSLYVDGWRVAEKELSLHGVLHAMQEEEQLYRRLGAILTTHATSADGDEAGGTDTNGPRNVALESAMLGKVTGYLTRATRRAMAAAGHQASTEPAAYAIGEKHVTWLNQVETEARLEGLSTKLSSFLTPGRGGPPFPRRSLVNFVFLWNPTSRTSLQSLSPVFQLRRQGLIARYGLALVDPTWSPSIATEPRSTGLGPASFQGESAGSQAALQISAVLHHLTATDDEDAVLGFLVELFQAAMQVETDAIPDDLVTQVCEKAAKTALQSSVAELLSDAGFLDAYYDTQAALRRFPVPEYPAIFLNGLQVEDDLNAMLQSEVRQLRSWVASNHLRDEMPSMYEAILHLRDAADHMQPALLGSPRSMPWASTAATVAFVETRPYVLSAAAAGEVAALTQLVAVPCDVTLAVLRQLETVMAAVQQCAAAVNATSKQHGVCTRLRVSFVTCPASTEAAASPFHSRLDVLQRWLARSRIAEGERPAVLHGFLSSVADAVASAQQQQQPSSSPSPAVSATAPLSRDALTAALKQASAAAQQSSLWAAADAAAADESQWARQGLLEWWGALVEARGGGSSGSTGVALATNGRLVAMDDTFSTGDVLAAAQLSAPLTAAVVEAVLNVDFAEMSRGVAGGYDADELDSTFFAGKAACIVSVFNDELTRHSAGAGTAAAMAALREESVAGTAEEWKRLRGVSFTVHSAGTEGAGSNSAAAAAATDADGATDETSSSSPSAEGKAATQLLHRVTAVVDPSSREAQMIVSLAYYLVHTSLRIRLTVVLNPSLDVKFPIRDFYEYVASPSLTFEDASGRVEAPAATFTQMPASALLTLGVEEPPSWTVFSQDAEVDLDNIMLSQLSRGTLFVTAVYRMHSVLVTGDVTNRHTGMAPDGLPLSLLPPPSRPGSPTSAAARCTDTLVMANLGGYYQLQASPGLWYLSIKPGPVAAAYCIAAVGGQPAPACADAASLGAGEAGANWSRGQHLPLLIDNFRGRHLSLQVRHTPGTDSATTLGGILQDMASGARPSWPPTWRSRGAMPAPPAKPTLNVFSVASGHLYERFLRMMMFSVHKTSSDKYGVNTTRIKFWVIENFLSPQFKRYIPLLAEQLGFEVGFVTYRWPWWLPRQTEKQRKIWAYKILFLDVLFPLDVDRVIFVDADQTAQADLHELYNMDIDDMPVAMTPFCQKFKNEATTRFRFWEQGFWVKHLRGKPYHISAIFLIDLRRFRAMLAGDRYRSTYAQLAGDPNSLANLDQDLPNYLQASIPIYSLPEQWLWCETWCSQRSKSQAKTIDLCNNPLTKMPKLENAKTIIPGWEELDNKLQNLSDTVLAKLGDASR